MARMYKQYKPVFEGKPVQKYLHARIIPCVKEVYVFALSHYDDKTQQMLADFDNKLKEASEEIYDLIGSKEVSSFKGFAYIAYWRNHKRANKTVMRLLSRMYLLLLRIKRKGKMQEEMALS